jgi:hypothetical protein
MKTLATTLTTLAMFLSIMASGNNAHAHLCAFSSDYDTTMHMEFHSFEKSDLSAGNFTIAGKIQINDTVILPESQPELFLHVHHEPDTSGGMHLFAVPQVLTLQSQNIYMPQAEELYPGDSILFDVTIAFDEYSLPFSYLTANIRMIHAEDVLSMPFYTYFTPYGSVEVWNGEDFEVLPRRWETG